MSGKSLAQQIYDIAQPMEGRVPFGDLVRVGDEVGKLERHLRAPDPHTERLAKELKIALDHIEHMAAFIGKQKAGYSFESLGEDSGDMYAALEAHRSGKE